MALIILCAPALAGGIGGVFAQGEAQRAESGPVIVADIKGAIGVGTGYFVDDVLDRAYRDRAELLVIRLDTPGGLVSATRVIIQAILASPIPVAVYVSPSGSRAASAGTYIAYAAHIAAMAPGTHIGAATPIRIGMPGLPGSPQPARRQPETEKPSDSGPGATAERKTISDAVAYLKSLAQLRKRNAEWAEKAVRDAATLTAEEALEKGVADVMATDLTDLLNQLEGRVVQTTAGERRLATRSALVVRAEADWKAQFLSAITDPNIAFILLMIGVYGIIFEFWSPGLTGPGIVGGISLVVALLALSALPLSYAGLALLGLGVALMVAEAVVPGFGVLGIGGTVAFAVGALFLFDPAGADIDFSVGWPLVIAASATSALLFIGVLGLLLRVRRKKVATGAEEMIDLAGEVMSWEGGRGRIRIHGEVWAARSSAPLTPGARVRVSSRDGLTLVIEPIEQRS